MSDKREQATVVRTRGESVGCRCQPDAKVPAGCRAAYNETFAIRAGRHYLVENRTPNRIRVHDHDYGDLWLAPLARREFEGGRLAPFARHLVPLRQRHQVRVRESTRTCSPVWRRLVLWLATLAALTTVAVDAIVFGSLYRAEAMAATAVFVAAVVVILYLAATRERDRILQARIADTQEADVEFGLGEAFYDGNDSVRRTKYITMLLVVILVGAVLPAVAILVATDAKSFLVMEGGLYVKQGMEGRLVSRLIQVIYVAVLSLFPALMYFQFDRQRVGTIRGGWVRSIFRMDPQMETLADIDARYGDQLAEASSFSTDSTRFLAGRYSPVIVATILIGLGWTLLILPTKSFDFAGTNELSTVVAAADSASERARAAAEDGSASDARAAAADAVRSRDAAQDIAAHSTGSSTTSTSEPDLPRAGGQAAAAASAAAADARAAEDSVQLSFFELLDPTPSAATMAFLGSYFFAVYLVLRGYFQGDLRPKLYNQITARLVTVVVIAYLINVLLKPSGLEENVWWAIAFLAGVVPITVLQRLGLLTSSLLSDLPGKGNGRLQGAFATTFATPRALTQIDGIDIYESARLESEGISDIPSLAKSDLVSMMVNTRMPVERLVDWSDQAMLLLLVDGGAGQDGSRGASEPSGRISRLRGMGIRTASSLLAVARDSDQRDRCAAAADIVGGDPLLQGLACQIDREPSTRRILHWREAELTDLSTRRPLIQAGDRLARGHAGATGNGSAGVRTPTP
ncbi:MAG TPA: hypothetical protein VKD21_01900 [Acidimicrobiales bacterium]|nr:hypothetical protein [Acidimicrobiales bacterium]